MVWIADNTDEGEEKALAAEAANRNIRGFRNRWNSLKTRDINLF